MWHLWRPSGGGKSTVAALVSRFYDPQKVQYPLTTLTFENGKRIISENKSELYLKSPFFLRHPFLKIYAMESLPQQKKKFTKLLSLQMHMILSLNFPEGYQTLVGERGVRLSGGQSKECESLQELSQKSQMLILDEATSALDAESEHLVQEALERLMEGRTTLIIAHRLSTIQDADIVAVLDKGRVSEMGSHDELMKKQGLYHKLVERQLA